MVAFTEHPAPADSRHAAPVEPDAPTRAFYVDCMRQLDGANVPYLVGGGYAMAHYTGIARNTKDLDLFVRPADRDRALATLANAGYRTELFYPFWIAKAIEPRTEAFIDLLYNSGNGLSPVDDEWFTHASEPVEVLGHRARLVPAEEQLWSKAFVMDRDRFDGADVVHLILALGRKLDWDRLIRRFADHERVLMAHVMLFGYVYPCERHQVPSWVYDQLQSAIDNEAAPDARVCRGTNLAQKGYGVPLREWGYADARIQPHGPLTPEELAQLPEP